MWHSCSESNSCDCWDNNSCENDSCDNGSCGFDSCDNDSCDKDGLVPIFSYLDSCARPPRSQGSKYSRRSRCCSYSGRIHHKVWKYWQSSTNTNTNTNTNHDWHLTCICTHCHPAYCSPYLPSHRYNGTENGFVSICISVLVYLYFFIGP